MSGLLLALDTAAARCAVALSRLDDGRLLARRDPLLGKGHAEVLMGLVGETLADAAADYADLAKIAVTVGPGSFTGVRVGVSAARALALALGVPAVGVTTLEALAFPHFRKGRPVVAAIDAKRGEIYAALFSPEGMPLAAPLVTAPDALAEHAAFRELAGDALFVGSGAALAAEALGLPAADRDTDAEWDIASVSALGAQKVPVAAPVPLYLRGADAKLAANSGIVARA
ncbi:tRNA (adenosine(37)-N6)-threonylcarbamoyltransferase complex dimerization subunit type 1 TsaB [Consotaella salsifontis]|uniref:tRNA threonylcarbamoyladenosine biosynthesis protein TsaB n=1 Tax=Consotaella salsifontis TaxID=1365950 RepID=A0A1T4S5K3_9HYPH|nr:tRNA (adenosine(37)-N6)-threonylcarbamoyltransferase complex dimerization subunit type 1 TsaB [Consotaella salsifontis]SKA23600.1 tRNA threonylcarbamoyladenosine biosynthesis protein TsaB [Consotaella salsifontis]